MKNMILAQIGLDDNQIIVYTFLLANGPSKAGVITKNTPLKRGLVYKILDDLAAMQIIIKEEREGAVALFTPLHPSALKSLAESKVREAQNAQNHLDSDIGSLIAMYNLANNKPGIEFYEGVKGVEKILQDTLRNTDEVVYSYVDSTTIEAQKAVLDIDQKYIKRRIKQKVQKKILMLKTPEAEQYVQKMKNNAFTEVRLIGDAEAEHFHSVCQIYNNKVAYITFAENTLTSTVISDASIYTLTKVAFEALWNKS